LNPPNEPLQITPADLRSVVASDSPELLSQETITKFLKNHWGALERADVDTFVSDYDTCVDWHNDGQVKPEYIKRQKKFFLRNWQYASYRIAGSVVTKVTSSNQIGIVSYPMKYEIANRKSGARSHGGGTDFIAVHVVDGTLKIFSEHHTLGGH
jgi:hypothetical protein